MRRDTTILMAFVVCTTVPVFAEDGGIALRVTSRPDAVVWVDGQKRGETPLEVKGLTVGTHEVRLIRKGYAPATRSVEVRAGAPALLDVALDADQAPAQARGTEQAGSQARKRGRKKWLIPAAVVVAGGAGAGVYVSYTRSSNEAPTAAFSIEPASGGMAGLTNYSFDAGASSDPDNDTLVYVWNFGDGSVAQGRTATHVYHSSARFYPSLVVYDGRRESATSQSVNVTRNLEGRWSGSYNDQYGSYFPVEIQMQQANNVVFGSYTEWSTQGSGGIMGTINSSSYVCPCPISFTISQARYQPSNFTGTVAAGSTRITGTISGSGIGSVPLELTR
jgi:hypothetical protein